MSLGAVTEGAGSRRIHRGPDQGVPRHGSCTTNALFSNLACRQGLRIEFHGSSSDDPQKLSAGAQWPRGARVVPNYLIGSLNFFAVDGGCMIESVDH